MSQALKAAPSTSAAARRPRLGFLGVGWIGLDRLAAVAAANCADIAAFAEPDPAMREKVRRLVPDIAVADGMDRLLEEDPDGIVIATPSALHAEQTLAALERGIAVFCQKPLGRNTPEVRRVIRTARRNDVLLGVDLSYRHTEATRRMRDLIRGGAIGRVFAADLTFHNAYGPDKPWFYDRTASGGGCAMDLGVHLVDLLGWTLDWPDLRLAQATLFRKGSRVGADDAGVEDYAQATIEVNGAEIARLACSWGLHAGKDAEISAVFHGTEGGLAVRNVGGSFFDFRLDLWRGTSSETLCAPPDDWGGRAICDWAARLAAGDRGFDDGIERYLVVAGLIDDIYAGAAQRM